MSTVSESDQYTEGQLRPIKTQLYMGPPLIMKCGNASLAAHTRDWVIRIYIGHMMQLHFNWKTRLCSLSSEGYMYRYNSALKVTQVPSLNQITNHNIDFTLSSNVLIFPFSCCKMPSSNLQ